MAATPSMPITDTARDRRPLVLFDDENRAKVRRPIGTIDDDGWTFVTYGPLDVWGASPIPENPNDVWADFTQAANNFVQAVNNFVQAANAPTHPPNHVPNTTANGSSGTDQSRGAAGGCGNCS